MTFDEIKDLPYEEANELLGGAVEDGLLSRQDGWRLIQKHIDYHEHGSVVARLKAEVEEWKAIAEWLMDTHPGIIEGNSELRLRYCARYSIYFTKMFSSKLDAVKEAMRLQAGIDKCE